MAYLKFVVLGLFVAAVIARFIYVVTKAVRIAVLKIDLPMVGFDSEPAAEAPVQEIAAVREIVEEGERVVEFPAGSVPIER